MFSALVLASSLLGYVSAGPSTTWMKPDSAIVKLDTPGYPLWVMDKANAPMMQSQSENYYWATNKPSAVLLNLTMSLDGKTLLVNHQAMLPFANRLVPPKIDAYQVPADISPDHIKRLAAQGLLNRQWDGLTLGYRHLALDYDRLVHADPESGPFINHRPTLFFRVLGLGAHSRNDVLVPEQQKVLRVELEDQNYGSSDSPMRRYKITAIRFETLEDSYMDTRIGTPGFEAAQCTRLSWICADDGIYEGGRKSAYRFIWRARFDKYGRIGSLRHALLTKMGALRLFWEDAGPAMMLSFGILMGISLVALMAVRVCIGLQKRWAKARKGDEYEDRLLGEGDFEEKYADEGEEQESPPPLPPRPSRRDELLIDLEAGEESR